MRRCPQWTPGLHGDNLTEMRQPSITCLDVNSCNFAHIIVQTSKFHVRVKSICTTFGLLVRQRIGISTMFSTLLYKSQKRAFPFAFMNKTFRDARLTECFNNFLTNITQKRFHWNTRNTMQKVTFPSLGDIHCFGRSVEFFLFGSPPACSVCLNAHLFPSLQPPFR